MFFGTTKMARVRGGDRDGGGGGVGGRGRARQDVKQKALAGSFGYGNL